MKYSRFLMLSVMFLSLFVVAPAYALCVKCVINECWGSGKNRTATNCYSYGSSCLTTGHCETAFEGGGGDGDETFDLGFVKIPRQRRMALNSEYILADVRIEHPRPVTTRLAAVKPAPRDRQLR